MGESPPRSSNRSMPRFDPVAGMRAMADIQAEGLHAAAELIERVVRHEPDQPSDPSQPTTAAGPYTALVDVWTDLLRRTMDGLVRPGEPGALTVAVDATGVAPELHLTLADSGSADAEVWLHNGSSSAVGPLVLHCGELSDSDGALLEGAEVRFEPAEVLLPARSSRGVAVSVVADGPVGPGIYRGTIQARGAPKLWLPLEVTIEPC